MTRILTAAAAFTVAALALAALKYLHAAQEWSSKL